jgi:hypothetical protein
MRTGAADQQRWQMWLPIASGHPQIAQCALISYRRRRISTPAAIARTASTVLTVAEIRRLSSGKSPVRINQIASRTIPRFLPAKELVIGIFSSLSCPCTRAHLSNRVGFFVEKVTWCVCYWPQRGQNVDSPLSRKILLQRIYVMHPNIGLLRSPSMWVNRGWL